MHEGGRTLLRAFRGGARSGEVGGLIEGALSRREALLPAAPGPEQDLLQGKAGLQTTSRQSGSLETPSDTGPGQEAGGQEWPGQGSECGGPHGSAGGSWGKAQDWEGADNVSCEGDTSEPGLNAFMCFKVRVCGLSISLICRLP